MIKKGDILIYTKDKQINRNKKSGELKKGEFYTVERITTGQKGSSIHFKDCMLKDFRVFIQGDSIWEFFIPLAIWREQQINSILDD